MSELAQFYFGFVIVVTHNITFLLMVLSDVLAIVAVVVCGTRNFAAKLLVSVSAFSLLDGPLPTLTDRCRHDPHLSKRFSCRLAEQKWALRTIKANYAEM